MRPNVNAEFQWWMEDEDEMTYSRESVNTVNIVESQ
jgi:hypothetical protein